jgi:hypothetical protein
MPKLALSYRRSDSSAITGRIFDRLAARYGKEAVFMDIDNIPLGTDFRTHIQEVWREIDAVIVVIGTHWLGIDAAGVSRLSRESDPVTDEIETAVALKLLLFPVLVDGAKMPPAPAVPESFGEEFVYLNAAEVSSGRDFHRQVDRLILEIDHALAKRAAATAPTGDNVSKTTSSTADDRVAAPASWRPHLVRYLIVPLVILLVAHHVIVNALDLNFEYLRAVSVAVPFGFGFALLWLGKRSVGAAVVMAAVLGTVAVAGMTVSEGLNSGQPILPQTRFEWRDNIEYALTISLSFIAGHALARALITVLSRRMRRTG